MLWSLSVINLFEFQWFSCLHHFMKYFRNHLEQSVFPDEFFRNIDIFFQYLINEGGRIFLVFNVNAIFSEYEINWWIIIQVEFFLAKKPVRAYMRRLFYLKTIQSFKIVSFIRSFLFFVWLSKRSLSFQHPNALYRAPLNIISKHTY